MGATFLLEGAGSPVPWDVCPFLENPAPRADAQQVGKGAGRWGSGADRLIKSLVVSKTHTENPKPRVLHKPQAPAAFPSRRRSLRFCFQFRLSRSFILSSSWVCAQHRSLMFFRRRVPVRSWADRPPLPHAGLLGPTVPLDHGKWVHLFPASAENFYRPCSPSSNSLLITVTHIN